MNSSITSQLVPFREAAADPNVPAVQSSALDFGIDHAGLDRLARSGTACDSPKRKALGK